MSTVLQTLGELCISQPKSKIKAGEGLKTGKYKFFTSSSIQDKYYNDYQYDKPALIFGTGGNASIHYCDEPFSTSTDCIVFYAKDKTVSLKAIYRFIEGNMHILEEGFHGAGLKHISKEYLLNIKISPNLFDVQNNVVNVFDKLSTLIEKRNQQLEKLDLLTKSKFNEMFEDKFKTMLLVEVCEELFAGGDVNKNSFSKNQTSKYPYPIYTNGEKNDGLYGYTDIARVYKEAVTISGRGTIGFACLRKIPFFPAVRLIVAIPNNKIINATYLLYFINSKNYGGRGASILQLTVPMIKNEKIPVPPIELQNEFSKFVEKTEKIKITIKQSLEKLDTLKKALMQKYFGGGNEITDYM